MEIMESQGKLNSKPNGESLISRTIVLARDQDEWLCGKRKELQRSASTVVRDLIREAMDREKRESENQKPND